MDATINENEIIYGLKNLDEAMAFEAKRNNIKTPDKIKLVLSVSVTHNGLEKLALEYVKLIIKKSLNLKFIEVYLFDEDICNKIYSIIFPKNDRFNKKVFSQFNSKKIRLNIKNELDYNNQKKLSQAFSNDFLNTLNNYI